MSEQFAIAGQASRSNIRQTLNSLAKGWLISAFGWGIFFFIFGWQIANTMLSPWQAILRMVVWDWLTWTFLTPLIFGLAIRLPIDRVRWKLSVPVHAILCVSILSLVGLAHPQPDFTRPEPPPHQIPRPLPPSPMLFGPFLSIYLLILSAGTAYYFYRRAREREMKAVELTASLAQARLRALRMQLHPHFLFNSLNALGSLIHKDPEAADEMLSAISDFLRMTLDDNSGQETPLRRELEFVLRYLAIEKIRFAERLHYSIEVPPEALDAMVPTLLLQPLIENAVRHGIEPQLNGGRITISALKKASSLGLKISDDGPGMDTTSRVGVGLTNTLERLRELYGDAASMRISSGHGTQIEIWLPDRLQT